MVRSTRIAGWTTTGAEPCCYMGQTRIAERRGKAANTVREHERQLAAAGLIEKRTLGNGHRAGASGRGIYFTPAIARLAEFEAVRAATEAEAAEARRLRDQRSTHKRHLGSALAELAAALGSEDARVQRLAAGLAAWPRADALHGLPLDALRRHERAADELCRTALDLLDDLESDGQPPEIERCHIQDTTKNSSYVACSKSDEGREARGGVAPEAPTGAPRAPAADEGQNGAEAEPEAEEAHRFRFVTNIGPERLYRLASWEMRFHLNVRQSDPRRLYFHDFTIAAQDRLRDLGIYPSAWEAAVAAMGADQATACVLILDAARDRPGAPVFNFGGCLRGMIRAHEQGKLNVMGSLIGLSERRGRERS